MTSVQHIAEQSIAFVRRAGLKVLDCKPGYAHCLIPLAGNENHMGSMYAGAQFTLADITGGVLALVSFDMQRFYPTLKDLKLEFLKPATSDLSLVYQLSETELGELQQSATANGKAKFLLQGELKDVQGSVVARASGEFQVRSR
ncbi:DUF4442 domain-containing protein [Permianibacter sp. IMCC34836]|uniref:PaaI family thioesterase n=1 Tax=Permianibacter fluminis TaxID=2738515 RepID=UPI0015552670|nr:YiiD C-terminal domain-containing protein [Permianibacter fluminis]NQD35943.1 DUF4442 domain-containing protein [Permianibacter fluminis]